MISRISYHLLILLTFTIFVYPLFPFPLFELIENDEVLRKSLRIAIGVMFIVKLVFLADYRRSIKDISKVSFADIFFYLSYFPSILWGICSKYNIIENETIKGEYLKRSLIPGIIFIGMALIKSYIVQLLGPWITTLRQIDLNSIDSFQFFTYGYTLPIIIYLTMSALSDVDTGVSYLIKRKTIRNFNIPFASRNVLEFCSRWNLTFTKWLYEYFYVNLYLYLFKFFKSAFARKLLALFCVFFVFSISALLHGNMRGAIWDCLLSAFALCFFLVAREILKLKFHVLYRFMKENIVFNIIFIFINYSFISVAFSYYFYDTNKLNEMLIRVFIG